MLSLSCCVWLSSPLLAASRGKSAPGTGGSPSPMEEPEAAQLLQPARQGTSGLVSSRHLAELTQDPYNQQWFNGSSFPPKLAQQCCPARLRPTEISFCPCLLPHSIYMPCLCFLGYLHLPWTVPALLSAPAMGCWWGAAWLHASSTVLSRGHPANSEES